nr:MAG TPA: hypothetical protein [Caudoviricetes sp.]
MTCTHVAVFTTTLTTSAMSRSFRLTTLQHSCTVAIFITLNSIFSRVAL